MMQICVRGNLQLLLGKAQAGPSCIDGRRTLKTAHYIAWPLALALSVSSFSLPTSFHPITCRKILLMSDTETKKSGYRLEYSANNRAKCKGTWLVAYQSQCSRLGLPRHAFVGLLGPKPCAGNLFVSSEMRCCCTDACVIDRHDSH